MKNRTRRHRRKPDQKGHARTYDPLHTAHDDDDITARRSRADRGPIHARQRFVGASQRGRTASRSDPRSRGLCPAARKGSTGGPPRSATAPMWSSRPPDIEIPACREPGDAVIVMECGDVKRTGIDGLERGYVINIDHHPGNTMYGALNWLDLSAAACGEMVFDLIRELGVPLTREIATHVYIAILTDTGSFHYSNITPTTFDICRQCMEAGVSPPSVARNILTTTPGRLKLFGACVSRMQGMHRPVATSCGSGARTRQRRHLRDTEGLINCRYGRRSRASSSRRAGRTRGGDMRSKAHRLNSLAKEFAAGSRTRRAACRGTLSALNAVRPEDPLASNRHQGRATDSEPSRWGLAPSP